MGAALAFGRLGTFGTFPLRLRFLGDLAGCRKAFLMVAIMSVERGSIYQGLVDIVALVVADAQE